MLGGPGPFPPAIPGRGVGRRGLCSPDSPIGFHPVAWTMSSLNLPKATPPADQHYFHPGQNEWQTPLEADCFTVSLCQGLTGCFGLSEIQL